MRRIERQAAHESSPDVEHGCKVPDTVTRKQRRGEEAMKSALPRRLQLKPAIRTACTPGYSDRPAQLPEPCRQRPVSRPPPSPPLPLLISPRPDSPVSRVYSQREHRDQRR